MNHRSSVWNWGVSEAVWLTKPACVFPGPFKTYAAKLPPLLVSTVVFSLLTT